MQSSESRGDVFHFLSFYEDTLSKLQLSAAVKTLLCIVLIKHESFKSCYILRW